jgi:hypothetical protein
MQFHPKALLATAAFVGLLWVTLERGFGLLPIAVVVTIGIACDLVLGWGFWPAIPEKWFSWFRSKS